MKNVSATLTVVILSLFLPRLAYSQEAEAPVYKEGDWWKVKVEFEHKPDFPSVDLCDEMYSEYLIKIEEGKSRVYGISGINQERIHCPALVAWVLGTRGSRLKFPLSLGLSWRASRRRRLLDTHEWVDHKVLAWEKVRTPKGVFDAFKISREWRDRPNISTYYYSPKVKSNVLFNLESRIVKRTVSLIDFNVSQ